MFVPVSPSGIGNSFSLLSRSMLPFRWTKPPTSSCAISLPSKVVAAAVASASDGKLSSAAGETAASPSSPAGGTMRLTIRSCSSRKYLRSAMLGASLGIETAPPPRRRAWLMDQCNLTGETSNARAVDANLVIVMLEVGGTGSRRKAGGPLVTGGACWPYPAIYRY